MAFLFYVIIDTKTCSIIWENVLSLLSCGLLYFNFADVYQKGYFSRVEKCILYCVVIYQSLSNTRYATEMMHMVACFKILLKSNLKQVWLDYYLINLSGKVDNFIADNWFGEKIMLLNKEKICQSANASSDEFLRTIMTMNVISLWKCWKVVYCITGATLHSKRHNLSVKLPDILLLVKYMTEYSLFYEQLGWTWLQNNL